MSNESRLYKDYPPAEGKGWIGVDLDGTLAFYDGWRGPYHIGEPIWPMFDRVTSWVSEGRTVKIFTARADDPEQVKHIHAWLKQWGLPRLEVTNKKDRQMIELWDDRAVAVVPNKGVPRD